MKALKNTRLGYGLVAILLHWSMALLIIGMLTLGIYMEQLPISLEKLKLYGWHKEYGVIVLELGILRLIWRLYNIMPDLPAHMPLWEKFAARATHLIFYGYIFLLPLTGWLMSSAAGLTVSFFGLFLLPNLIGPDPNTMHLLKEVHKWLGYSLIGVIGLHTAAALRHHFIDKDDVLKGMLK